MKRFETSIDYPGYVIYEDGTVYSNKRHKYLSQYWCAERKYKRVKVTIGGISIGLMVHRAVCTAFHGSRPSSKHQVNHIDGNKLNNHYSNLEWVTQKENLYHAMREGLHANSFQNTYIVSPAGDVIFVENLSEFCRQNNLQQGNLRNVIKGNRKHHKGWTRYEEQ